MKKYIKKILYPLRRLLTKLILIDDIVPTPISLASTYIHSEDVQGDYLEFGCFKGYSFINAYHKIKSAAKTSSLENQDIVFNKEITNIDNIKKTKQHKRKFYAFDSFEGLPAIEKSDGDHPLFFEGSYFCSEKEFIKNISEAGVSLEDVIIVPGYYQNTLNKSLKGSSKLKKAAIIMIDCDLYESTKIVLDFITDIIDNGTIIIFDDWFAYKAKRDMGEQRACKEWLEKNKSITLVPYARYSYTQMSFIANKI